MTQVAKHIFAFAVAVIITVATFSETVAVPTQQFKGAPAALAA
jgi:hypothetical protein